MTGGGGAERPWAEAARGGRVGARYDGWSSKDVDSFDSSGLLRLSLCGRRRGVGCWSSRKGGSALVPRGMHPRRRLGPANVFDVVDVMNRTGVSAG